jgi:nicotinamide-nucleotide amidase
MRAEGADLIVTSGGLGPTADDMTAQVVADFAQRPLELDEDLERRIGEIIARFARRWRIDQEALQIANRKQAMVPRGAIALDPVGTAPGLVVPAGDQLVVVLPGPPRELHGSWAQAVETEPFRSLAARAPRYRQTMLRLFGIPESEIAETLRVAEQEIGLDGLEVTTCLRRGELEVVVRSDESSDSTSEALAGLIAERHADALFSVDGSSIEEQVASLIGERRLAVGESCTGGLLATRLTDRAGASAYFAGGVVAYSNEAKTELLGVDPGLIGRHGAVSDEVAEALAAGAIERFGADIGIGLTGIAGPEGGTADKPVGRVCFCVMERDGDKIVRALDLPGSRADIRDRATTVALHLLRRLLRREAVPL